MKKKITSLSLIILVCLSCQNEEATDFETTIENNALQEWLQTNLNIVIDHDEMNYPIQTKQIN